jgi:hypothetical protein
MWHAFSVLFRVGASLGLRHGRNPRLVCGAHSGHSAALRSLDPAAAHDPASEKTKHTQAPTVLWACSPQHSRETGVLGAAERTGNRCLSTLSIVSILSIASIAASRNSSYQRATCSPHHVTGHRLIIGRFLLPCNGTHLSCLLCGTPSACCSGWGLPWGCATGATPGWYVVPI